MWQDKLANDDSDSNWVVTLAPCWKSVLLTTLLQLQDICAYACSGMYKISASECGSFGQQYRDSYYMKIINGRTHILCLSVVSVMEIMTLMKHKLSFCKEYFKQLLWRNSFTFEQLTIYRFMYADRSDFQECHLSCEILIFFSIKCTVSTTYSPHGLSELEGIFLSQLCCFL